MTNNDKQEPTAQAVIPVPVRLIRECKPSAVTMWCAIRMLRPEGPLPVDVTVSTYWTNLAEIAGLHNTGLLRSAGISLMSTGWGHVERPAHQSNQTVFTAYWRPREDL